MVRVTPFLPLISSAVLLAPTAANRQETYAGSSHKAHFASVHMKRDLLTCEQTYGSDWVQCGAAESGFCYNPSEGQSCCAQDSGYCDAGTWCAPVAGFCCLQSEDVATCAQEAGFDLPASSGGLETDTVLLTATLTRSSTTTRLSATTTSTTLSAASGAPLSTSCTDVGGLTWTSIYPATITGFVNGNSSTKSTGSAAPSSTFVQVSVAQKEQWTLLLMTVAMGVVGVFMATC